MFDIWKQYYPQPIDIKYDSVYDYYDILEEIGTWVLIVLCCIFIVYGEFSGLAVVTNRFTEDSSIKKVVKVVFWESSNRSILETQLQKKDLAQW